MKQFTYMQALKATRRGPAGKGKSLGTFALRDYSKYTRKTKHRKSYE